MCSTKRLFEQPPSAFERIPTDRLIEEKVRPEHLKDDTLGRSLDDLFDSGITDRETLRPDLNQALLDMIVECKPGVPMKPATGNASEHGNFPELIDQYADLL